MKKIPAKKHERGQAITEYVLLASIIMVGLGLVITAFLGEAGNFYQNVVRIASIPFP